MLRNKQSKQQTHGKLGSALVDHLFSRHSIDLLPERLVDVIMALHHQTVIVISPVADVLADAGETVWEGCRAGLLAGHFEPFLADLAPAFAFLGGVSARAGNMELRSV